MSTFRTLGRVGFDRWSPKDVAPFKGGQHLFLARGPVPLPKAEKTSSQLQAALQRNYCWQSEAPACLPADSKMQTCIGFAGIAERLLEPVLELATGHCLAVMIV